MESLLRLIDGSGLWLGGLEADNSKVVHAVLTCRQEGRGLRSPSGNGSALICTVLNAGFAQKQFHQDPVVSHNP